MTTTTLSNLMQAAIPASDLALQGDMTSAIALLVAEGATASFAASFLADYLAAIAARAAEQDLLERIAYNTNVLVAEGMSLRAAQDQARRWA